MDLRIGHRPASDDAGAIIVELAGELDLRTCRHLSLYLTRLIERQARAKLVVDLDKVRFVDSAGLGVLVSTLKKARSAGGSLVIAFSDQRLQGIFALSGLDDLFWIRSDAKAAAAMFNDMQKVRAKPGLLDRGWPWLSSKVYLNDPEHHEQTEAALADVINAFGLQVSLAFAPVQASWFREFLLRIRRSASEATPPLEDQLTKLVRGLEMQALHRPQAEIDAAQGDAVAKLVAALELTPRAVVQIGSILVVKVDGALVVRNLTQLELAYWERNPVLFRDPEAALNQLQQANVENERRDPPPAVSA